MIFLYDTCNKWFGENQYYLFYLLETNYIELEIVLNTEDRIGKYTLIRVLHDRKLTVSKVKFSIEYTIWLILEKTIHKSDQINWLKLEIFNSFDKRKIGTILLFTSISLLFQLILIFNLK